MTDLNSIFDQLVKSTLWPKFKALGYKKSGNNFRYYSPEGWGRIIQFQKSQYNSADSLSFTVNVSLYLEDFEYYLSNQKSGLKFQEVSCAVRKRYGHLRNSPSDSWIELTVTSDIAKISQQLINDFDQYVHSYLVSIKSREDIYAFLLNGHHSHYPSAQIQTMFHAGYQQEALKLFTSEFIRSKNINSYRNTLNSIARELEFPA
ncbi:DUF4304 domain-containing protein [Hymenobacter psoromatis]|uniref:DUF4304 domain-containing protein n=1 Tax=Hymenobacter psoromatis TaxID=1484116 RepID=UPI001CBAE85A|nr:DUF4304 domain-containing protein [Hymenobacter psoromatis]